MNKLTMMRLLDPDPSGNSGGGGTGAGSGSGTEINPGSGAGSGGTSDNSILNSGKGGAADWRESISDADLKSHPSLKDFKNVDGLAKSYVNAQKLIGQQRLELPNEKWGDKEWNDFYNKVGRPEKPDGYKIERPQLPEGMQYNEGLEKSFLEVAHKAGLTPKQVAAIAEFHNGSQVQQFQTSAAERSKARESAIADLRKEYGDRYDSQITAAGLAAKNIGGDQFIAKLDKVGLSDDPDMIKFLAHVGSFMQEDKAGAASSKGFVGGATEAAAEIEQLRGDPEFLKAYENRSHPGYKAAQERMTRLYSIKHSGK